MKKVLFVFNHPAPYKVRLLNALSKHFDLTVIFERTNNKDRNKEFYFEQNYAFKTVKIKGCKLGKENFLSNGITKHLKKNKYDLIVMNGYSNIPEILAINYLSKNNIPFLLYINGGIIKRKESKLKKLVKTRLISSASCYMSPDKNSTEYLKYYGAKKEYIFEYPYSTIFESQIINGLVSKSDQEKLQSEYGFQGEKIFISAGQLIKRKNYLSLVNAWQKAPKNYSLYIYGEGPTKKEIERKICNLGLKNVFLQGYLTNNELLKRLFVADAFIFPSNEDIYGHVINEAMSQGLPVISTDKVNSARKLIIENKNGFLITDIKSNDFTKALGKVNRKTMYQFCIKTAQENTIEKMVVNHVKIFNEVIKK